MKYSRSFVAIAALLALSVYLFVSAPPPLPRKNATGGATLPVNVLLNILAAENAVARSTYTANVVGPGLKQNLKFNETWKDGETEAGPLPAILLRDVSSRMQRSGTEVGLFLGSDFPISPPNKFTGLQNQYFQTIKATKKPEYFKDPNTGMFTAMFIDPASAQACVNCHNAHSQSPKKDWVLNDPMGATTWLFPRAEVTEGEILDRIAALRRSVREAYQSYLDRAAKFSNPAVQIGDKWPRDGLFLPDADTFMAAVAREASEKSLETLIMAKGEPSAVPAR